MNTMRLFLLGTALVGSTAVAPAGATAEESTAQDVAYGAGSVLTTLVYAPLKASFCILGAITAGFTLPFGGPETAGTVASRACGGTWAITPDALMGREQVSFLGGDSSPGPAARR
jgi:hypothetical protein